MHFLGTWWDGGRTAHTRYSMENAIKGLQATLEEDTRLLIEALAETSKATKLPVIEWSRKNGETFLIDQHTGCVLAKQPHKDGSVGWFSVAGESYHLSEAETELMHKAMTNDRRQIRIKAND